MFDQFSFKYVFEIVVTVQSTFRLEIHQNKVFFYFFQISFDINTSKTIRKYKKIHFKQKKISNFERTRFAPRSQTLP